MLFQCISATKKKVIQRRASRLQPALALMQAAGVVKRVSTTRTVTSAGCCDTELTLCGLVCSGDYGRSVAGGLSNVGDCGTILAALLASFPAYPLPRFRAL
jgi:hypothetical protein